MGIILVWVGIGFLVLRSIVVIYNLVTNPILKSGTLRDRPKVSILVPARNEAEILAKLISQVKELDYQNFELIILNDNSEDETEEVLNRELSTIPHSRYLSGTSLPENWLGKNWACHQLAQAATGDYLLFLDADVASIDPRLVESALSRAQELSLSLLSIFPDQVMKSPGEKTVVPLMHFLLLSLLPLWWIYQYPFPSMSAANGQFMLFEGKSYRKHWWHKRVKHVIVEDIEIMKEVKRQGLKGMALLGNGLISTRMYRGWEEGVSGFSKNLLAGFGNSVAGLVIYLIFSIFIWVWATGQWWVHGGGFEILVILATFFGIRIGISIMSRQPIMKNLLLHPVQMGTLAVIGVLSIYKRIKGKILWKGRNVYT